jgi:hypothetical protein
MELQHRFVTMALVEVSVVEDIIGVYFNIFTAMVPCRDLNTP